MLFNFHNTLSATLLKQELLSRKAQFKTKAALLKQELLSRKAQFKTKAALSKQKSSLWTKRQLKYVKKMIGIKCLKV